MLESAKVIIISVLIARYYGPENFGKFSFIISIVSIVSIVAEFRIQNVLTKDFSKKNHDAGLLLGSAMSVNMFFSFIGFMIVGVFSLFENDDVVKMCLLIYATSFFFKIPRSYRAYFIAHEKNRIIAVCEIYSSILSLLLLGYCISISVDLYILVISRTSDFLIFGLFIYMFFSREKFKEELKYRFDRVTAKKLITLSAPLVLSGFAMILFQRIDLILVRQLISDYAAGIYSASLNITLIFSIIPLVISESIAPKMYRVEKEEESYLSVRHDFIFIVTSVGVLLSVVMFIMGGAVLKILYGEEYMSGLLTMKILSFCPFLISLGAAAGQVIVADERQKGVFKKSIIALILTIISNLLLVPTIGIEGAAISTVLGLLLANFILHYYIDNYKYLFRMQCLCFKRLIHMKSGV